MKLENFNILSFADKRPPNAPIEVIVPEGSRLAKMLVVHEGIKAIYEVPSLEISTTQTERYQIIVGNIKEIPDGATLVDILSHIVETDEGQGIMIFPVYKLKA